MRLQGFSLTPRYNRHWKRSVTPWVMRTSYQQIQTICTLMDTQSGQRQTQTASLWRLRIHVRPTRCPSSLTYATNTDYPSFHTLGDPVWRVTSRHRTEALASISPTWTRSFNLTRTTWTLSCNQVSAGRTSIPSWLKWTVGYSSRSILVRRTTLLHTHRMMYVGGWKCN